MKLSSKLSAAALALVIASGAFIVPASAHPGSHDMHVSKHHSKHHHMKKKYHHKKMKKHHMDMKHMKHV